MRIWILNHYASPPDRPAGTRHYEFGRVLAAQGHQVTIFASSFSHFSRREERLRPGQRVRMQDVDGVRFVWLRTGQYSRNDWRRAMNMATYAARATVVQWRLQRPDVVVGSSVHLAAVAAAWLIAAARRASFVFEVRDLWPQTLIDMGALGERSAAARLLRMAESFFYRRARTVICLLPGAAEYIAGRGISPDKVVYVPNGITDVPHEITDHATCQATAAQSPAAQSPAAQSPAAQSPAAQSLTAQPLTAQSADLLAAIRQRRDDGCLVAGYVGSLGPANGVSDLVLAARELRDRDARQFALVLVGDGQEKDACQRLADRHGLDNVLFWPPVPKSEVPAVLAELDVTLFCLRDLPVFRYGLSSNKLFDYLASGRPVVFASGVTDGPVHASGGGICVPAQSPARVADALVALAGLGEAERLAVGERGRTWVYRHHGTTALASRFLQALMAERR